MSLEEMLDLMTLVHEYSELPVRHNEDNLNGELAKRCPIDVNSYTLDSSHTKAHLLLQAHMSRLQLPHRYQIGSRSSYQNPPSHG